MNELASDGLLRLLVGEEGRTALDIKKILTEYHKHSNKDAEKVLQSALDRGILDLGDQLKLVPSTKTNVFKEIAAIRSRIEEDEAKLADELYQLQEKCTHGGNMTHKYGGSSGNWDRADDCYWITWKCHDCGKQWTTDQDNAWHLENKVYPNSKRVKNDSYY